MQDVLRPTGDAVRRALDKWQMFLAQVAQDCAQIATLAKLKNDPNHLENEKRA